MTPCANRNLHLLEYSLVSDSIQLNGFLSSAYSTKISRLLESHRLSKYSTTTSKKNIWTMIQVVSDRSKAVLLLWIFYVFVLSCVCYVFVRVCVYVLCGHLLGKGWPLGSRLWCLLWVCHFPIGILGQVWYLIVSIPDLCTLTYFRWSSLISSPSVIRCIPGVGFMFMFLIFINDLPDNIRSSVCLFADDCVLYKNIYSIQDCLTLQEDLTIY